MARLVLRRAILPCYNNRGLPRLLPSNAGPSPAPVQSLRRFFCSEPSGSGEKESKKINTKVNFSLPDSDSEDDDDNIKSNSGVHRPQKQLPPPYDPFNKKPISEEPEDPKNLQEIFHKMRSEGLTNSAVKMFDALSKDGLTHEALELFAQIKDKGQMPDVVAHTAVIEAYATAGGQSKAALKVFLRMLSSGIAPNAYTYSVLVKGLAGDGRLGDAKKYLMEMTGKGIRPNAGTYTPVFEAFAREQKVEEAKEFLQKMKDMGFVADENAVKEVISNKRSQLFRNVINILFDN